MKKINEERYILTASTLDEVLEPHSNTQLKKQIQKYKHDYCDTQNIDPESYQVITAFSIENNHVILSIYQTPRKKAGE